MLTIMASHTTSKRTACKKLHPKKHTASVYAIPQSILAPQPPQIFRYFGCVDPFKPHHAIHQHEIAQLLGVSLSAAAKIMTSIRRMPGKSKHPFITVTDFCQYFKFIESEIQDYFKHLEEYECLLKMTFRK